MEIKIFKDLKKFALTSSITKEDFDLLAKQKPSALCKTDEEGNDLFSIDFSKDHSSLSKFGITFGAVKEGSDNLMVVGNIADPLPNGYKTAKEYVADAIGFATTQLAEFEESIPTEVAEIKASREKLIGNMTEA